MCKSRWSFLVLALFLAIPLFAQAPGNSLRQDAASYASQFNVPLDEATRRLELQRAVSDLDAALTQEEAGTFAGLWIQHAPQYRVIARFTNRAAEARLNERVAGTPLAAVIETRSARWSLVDLEQKQADVRGKSKKAEVAVESDILVAENKVEAYTLDPSKLSARLAAVGARLPEGVEVRRINQLSAVDGILGGQGLYDCSAGFGVRAPNGELGISTAGHCSNDQYYQGIWLPFRAEKSSGEHDVQWNSTCDRVDVSNRIDSGIGIRSITSTRPRASQAIGTYVCKMGMGTGRTCGTIISKTYDVGPNFHSTFIRVDGYQLRGPGDSGAPWFVEDVAYGIHRGAPGSDLNDAIYMAIDYISGIGVSVLTYDPGPGCALPPVANFSYTLAEPEHYLFDASSSYDPDGYIVNYFWDFGDGTYESSSSPYTEHFFGPGPYVVYLTVTDNEGLTRTHGRPINVQGPGPGCGTQIICE